MNHIEVEQLADRLLPILRKKAGTFFKTDDLSKKLGFQPAIINSAVEVLASWNYKLKKRRDAVAFVEAPDNLTAAEIAFDLKTTTIGQRIFAYKSTRSTNDLAGEMAENGAPEGTIVVSDEQTKGRGRLGRQWHSPAGTGIYLSIILRPDFPTEMAPGVSIMTAVALADTIAGYSPGEVRIKWPNDILIGGKKAAGILTELSAEREKINHIVVGVGINVNQGLGSFPEDLRDTATSLRRSVKRKVRRVKLLQSFLLSFEKEYATYKKYRLKKSHSRIKKYSSLIGREIKVRSGRHITAGKVVDIDIDGRLVVEQDGQKIYVTAGEVTVVKQ